jgi:hypothetical protein
MIRAIGTTVMLTGLAAGVLAQGGTPKLNIKMGLWQMTTTMTMTGNMPMPDLSKLPPDQQEKVKAQMGAMMGTPQTHTDPKCMTKESFDKADFTGNKNCKTVLTTNTASAVDLQVTCTEQQGTTTGTMHIEAPTTESIKATLNGSAVMGAQTMKMSGTMTGKWVSTDCGTVK